jgi:peptidyl-tRNA hydrolase
MKDHETPEAIQARAEQEDPIVMYLIVHETLNMGTGKMVAQGGHAASMITIEFFQMKEKIKVLQKKMSSSFAGDRTPEVEAEYFKLACPISIFGEWMASSFRKVTLKADDKEWAKIKEEFKNQHMVMVVDAGLTEIPSGSETVIALWPMRKSQRPKSLIRLQALK